MTRTSTIVRVTTKGRSFEIAKNPLNVAYIPFTSSLSFPTTHYQAHCNIKNFKIIPNIIVLEYKEGKIEIGKQKLIKKENNKSVSGFQQ